MTYVLRTPSITYSNALLLNTKHSTVHNLTATPRLLTTLPSPLNHALILRRTNILVYTSTRERVFFIFDLRTERKCLEVEFPHDIIGFYWVKDSLLCRTRSTETTEAFYLLRIETDKVTTMYSFEAAGGNNALNAVGISDTGAIATRSTKKGSVVYYPDINSKEMFKHIDCHQGDIQAIALSADGSLMATCSSKGTIIRIWNMKESTPKEIQSLRRGSSHATIYSLCFSNDNQYLVVTSSHPTIHLFSIAVDGKPSKNAQNLFGFGEEKSFASYSFQSPQTRPPSFATFNSDNTIWYISEDGKVLLLEFNPLNGGEMVLKSEVQLYDPKA